VTAMTDVTGFGLLGHLVEMADGSRLTARIEASAVPRLASVDYYLEQGCVPGGTLRNFDSYGGRISKLTEWQKHLLCDPQTSGGLLVAVAPEGQTQFLQTATDLGLSLRPIGTLIERQANAVEVF
ncbi:AIR synthase-related protein, partial [Pseudomonas quasicaspiana]|nr:AIR synthase-related protein [Pseudomonas quasicaspiana]